MDNSAQIPLERWATNNTRLPSDFDLRTLPLIVTGAVTISFSFLFALSAARRANTGREAAAQNSPSHTNRAPSPLARKIQSLGGGAVAFFALSDLLGSVLLCGLSSWAIFGANDALPSAPPPPGGILTRWPELSFFISFVFASMLFALSLVSELWRSTATRGARLILLSALGVYFYRDVWPFATYDAVPQDLSQGSVIWIKIILLFNVAVINPLISPRKYVPVDPSNPMLETTPEQTCSILSLVFYSFLDPLFQKGYRVEHLSYTELPLLLDRDRAQYVTKKAFEHLDPLKLKQNGHIFFSMFRVFKKEIGVMTLVSLARVALDFAFPISINRILNYLETGQTTTVRPWVWIALLVIGPLFKTLGMQWYLFLSTQLWVHIDAVVTQLVFQHSLRVRMKAEISYADASADPSNPPATTTDSAVPPASDDSPHSEAGTQSQEPTQADASQPPPEVRRVTKTNNLLGRMNSLVTSDLATIKEAKELLCYAASAPVHIISCVVFLYALLGWRAWFLKMRAEDARLQAVTEAVRMMRMVKLFGWEDRVARDIEEKREKEMQALKKLRIMYMLSTLTGYLTPMATMLTTYGVYTVIMRRELTGSIVFSSISIFSMIRSRYQEFNSQLNLYMRGKVSLERLQEFLTTTELLDEFADNAPYRALTDERTGFKDMVFEWSKPEEGAGGPSNAGPPPYRLRIQGELVFRSGELNMIIGPTGSGNTSILMALLGEMHAEHQRIDSWHNIPRHRGVAYAAQESWVQSATIRDNILFGATFDEERYRKVIYQCALERDLELFEAGDKTEVGERGLTLSGGQKARVTLARAVYSNAKTLLLDDILAALDVHTSSWIVNKCLKGDLVQGRTVLLVTHNIALVAPIARLIVTVGADGKVHSEETLEEALESDKTLREEFVHDNAILEEEARAEETPEQDAEDTTSDGKLFVDEEITEGRITWKSFKLLLASMGGEHRFIYFAFLSASTFLVNTNPVFQVWWLGHWGSQYEHHPASEVNVAYYLGVATGLLVLMMMIYAADWTVFIIGTLRASRSIHRALINSVLTSTLRWLDKTPTGRIMTRCSQDMQSIDDALPPLLTYLFDNTWELGSKFIVVMIFTPIFLSPAAVIAVIGFYIGYFYLRTQLSVRREMSNAKAPVMTHFNEATAGLISIRAYAAQDPTMRESLRRIDHYLRIARTSYTLNRWIEVRIGLLGSVFVGALATYLVYGRRQGSSANTGFSLNMAVDLATQVLACIKALNEFEVEANSLERVQGYLDIEHEPQPTAGGVPPAAWPTSGDLRVHQLSARYSKNGPKVLQDISFHIKSGERIGVVGRTGSGKSSLMLSLLRCIVTEGAVYYDGLRTDDINLDSLRGNITIIPQVPELFGGSLRLNLDPMKEHDDSILNDALRASGLSALQQELGKGGLTLDSEIASGGTNLSVGQRQILALARALVRKSKLLILDEATSAIDYKTDAIIQTTLRKELDPGVTVITVAHRLQTVMDSDRIMVLDSGRLVEFDSPKALLGKPGSLLAALVDESNDKEKLYAMADATL